MTPISSHPTSRAPRLAHRHAVGADVRAGAAPPPSRAARLRVRAAAIAAGAALAAGAVLGAAPSWAAPGPSPSPSPSPTLSGVVQASVAPTGGGAYEPGRPLNVYASLQNGMPFPLQPSAVTMTVAPTTLNDRASVAAWLAGEHSIGGMKSMATGQIAAVASGTTGSVLLTVPATDPSLTALSPGVHAVAATITGGAQSYTAQTVITVPAPKATVRTPVGIVVPITAGPLQTGLLTEQQLAKLTAPGGDLTADLNAVTGTTAILAVDPAIPAAIRVLGTSAPADALAWLDRLDSLPNERFALQFGDADVAVQVEAGRTSLLRPTSLRAYEQPADFTPKPDEAESTPTPAPTATAAPTASPAPSPGAPDFPSLSALLNIGPGTRAAVTWPFTGSASAKDVQALGAMSSGKTRAVTLIPSDTTTAGAHGAVVRAHGTAGRSDVLVYDSTVSADLRTASTTESPELRGAPLAAATADLTLAAQQAHGAPILVVLDRASTHVAPALSDAVEVASQAPATSPASLTALLTAPAAPVTVTATATHTARAAAFSTLQQQERDVAAFATVLTDPALLTGPQRATTLQLLGGGWLDDTSSWQAALTAHAQAATATLDSVAISPSSDINLAGTSAPLRFGVRNDLPWPVTVDLITMPNDLRLEVQHTTKVVAEASSTTRVAVPVRARIGNGDVTLMLHLVSPTGVRIGATQYVSLNVRADWETIGLTVLLSGIGIFVVLGVIRTIRRRRRARLAGNADKDAS